LAIKLVQAGDYSMRALLILSLILADAMTPSTAASSPKPSLEVQVLGSGGPRAFGRAGSSYIVLVDGTPRILLDAGPGAFVRIGELNIDLQQVDIVLLTHLHIDHSGDLAAFFNARALTSDGPIKYRVFGPDGAGLFPKTSRFVDLLVSDNGLFSYQKTFGARETFSVRDLAINLNTGVTKIVDENGLVVEEIATHHGDCPSVAYRITYHGTSVVFSGDMDASAVSNLVRLAKSADLLVFNCAVLDPPNSPSQLYELHTPPKKIGEAARECGVGTLLLSHIAPDVEESKTDVMKSIRGSFMGPVEFATDRMRVSVEDQHSTAH
jgi:ribonuclease BN (tRNA processing enzyme)